MICFHTRIPNIDVINIAVIHSPTVWVVIVSIDIIIVIIRVIIIVIQVVLVLVQVNHNRINIVMFGRHSCLYQHKPF